MKKTILMIGGTGMLGQPVSRSLKESGFGRADDNARFMVAAEESQSRYIQ